MAGVWNHLGGVERNTSPAGASVPDCNQNGVLPFLMQGFRRKRGLALPFKMLRIPRGVLAAYTKLHND